MEENKEEQVLTKKQLKLRAQEMKLEEKQRKMEEKAAIKAEKERRKNSFGRKVRNFFLGIIFVAILLLVGFYFAQKFLTEKEKELSDEKMSQIYQNAVSAIGEKNYEEAIELLKSIDADYSKYSEVETKLKEAEQAYLNDYLTEADNLLKDEKFEKALKELDKIDEEFKNEEVIVKKRIEILIAKLDSEVTEMANSKTTLKILEYLVNYDSNNIEEIEDELDNLISKYKNDFILESRELIKTDITKATTNINAAYKLLPKDKDIKALVKELETATEETENSETTEKDEKETTTTKNKDEDIEE